MSKIILTSDWHLGYRQYGLKHREQDRYDAAWAIINHAITHQSRAILNGGDILDVVRPTSKAVNELKRMHVRLQQAGIPMLLVQGNHDKSDPPWFNLFLDDSNKTSGIQLLENRLFELPATTDQPAVTVYGMPEQSVDKMVSQIEAAPKADILLTHISVREWIGFPSETAMTLESLPKNKFKAVVIGDTHITDHRTVQGSLCVSPGAIELGASDEAVTKVFQELDVQAWTVQDIQIPTRFVDHIHIESEADVQPALAQLKLADECEGLVYITYDPTIPTIVSRINQQKTKDSTHFKFKTFQASTSSGETVATSEEDGDELLPLEHFAPRYSEDPIVLDAFKQSVTTESPMSDIVSSVETQVLEYLSKPA